jgi:hypothetical protein
MISLPLARKPNSPLSLSTKCCFALATYSRKRQLFYPRKRRYRPIFVAHFSTIQSFIRYLPWPNPIPSRSLPFASSSAFNDIKYCRFQIEIQPSPHSFPLIYTYSSSVRSLWTEPGVPEYSTFNQKGGGGRRLNLKQPISLQKRIIDPPSCSLTWTMLLKC